MQFAWSQHGFDPSNLPPGFPAGGSPFPAGLNPGIASGLPGLPGGNITYVFIRILSTLFSLSWRSLAIYGISATTRRIRSKREKIEKRKK